MAEDSGGGGWGRGGGSGSCWERDIKFALPQTPSTQPKKKGGRSEGGGASAWMSRMMSVSCMLQRCEAARAHSQQLAPGISHGDELM